MGLKRQIVVIVRRLIVVRLLLRSIAVHCRLLPLIAVLRLLIALLCLIWLLIILPVVGLLPVVAALSAVVGLLLLIGYIDIVPLLLSVVGLLPAIVAVLRLLLIILLSVALRLGEVAVLRLHRPGAPLVAVVVGVILHLHRADHGNQLPLVEILAHEVGSLPPRVHVEEVGGPLAVLSRIIPLHGKREFGESGAALSSPVIRLGGEPSHSSTSMLREPFRAVQSACLVIPVFSESQVCLMPFSFR